METEHLSEPADGELLDRTTHLHAAHAALTEAAGGTGLTLALVGAAGMGKSSLIRHIGDQAAHQGFEVLAVSGELLEREFAWGAVRRLLHPVGHRRGGAAALAEIARGDAAHDSGSLFAALHGLHWLAVELAQQRPLALIIDDAHWLDPQSLRWLAYLAARLADDPILLVIATRPGPLEADDGAWPSLLAAARVLELAPLGERSCARLVEHALGVAPDRAFAAYCRRATGGNPFLLLELAHGIAQAGLRPNADGLRALERRPAAALTPSVALRLHRLGPQAVAVARVAAVLGPHATPSRIAAVGELDASTVDVGIARLAADRLITVSDAITFAHPLLRTAAGEDFPPAARERAHAAAARLLLAEHADSDVVAGHVLLASRTGDAAFVRLLREAARRAGTRAAPDSAVRYLERAMSEPPAPAQRAEVLIELGDALLVDRPQDAAAPFGEALARSATVPQQVAARLGLAQALVRTARFTEAADVLEEGLDTVDGSDPAATDALRAALLNTARWHLDARPRCWRHIRVLRARAQEGDPLPTELHANLAIELLAEGVDRAGCLHHAQAAVARALIPSESDFMGASIVITPLACAGDLRGALAVCDRIIASARPQGQRMVLAVTLAARAWVQLWAGRVRDAIVDGDDALVHADDPVSVCFGVIFLAEAYACSDRLDDAWGVLENHGLTGPVPEFWPYPWLRSTRAWLRYLRGESQVLDELAAAGRFSLRYGLRCPAVVPWRERMALASAALGHRERARRLAKLNLQAARRWGEPRTLAAALTLSGVLTDGPAQLELLRDAAAVSAGADQVLSRTNALIALGSALRRRGQRREAREALGEAQHLAQATGALRPLRLAREELLAAGGRPRRAAARGIDALTPSEIRVARLAAQGRSNPEIAQLLFVTRRTVETHLTSIYGKLGVRGRAGLAEALAAA